MEDVLKFLFIAVFIIIGIAKQFKKEAKKNAESKPATSMPLPDADADNFPFPLKPKKKQKAAAQPAKAKPPQSAYTPLVVPGKESASTIGTPEPEEPSEFSIHSAEEARRALIWSEILQRKY